MKKIDLSNVVPNVRGLILEDASLQHIMNAYQEGFEAILAAMGCDPDVVTILSGLISIDGSDYTITGGWAAYAGEIFQFDDQEITIADTAVWIMSTTYLASDPVKFDDGNEFNINQIRKLTIADQATGTGLCDHVDSVNPYPQHTAHVPSAFSGDYSAAYTSGYIDSLIVPGGIMLNFALTLNLTFGSASDGTGVFFIECDSLEALIAPKSRRLITAYSQLAVVKTSDYLADIRTLVRTDIADPKLLISLKIGDGVPSASAADYEIVGQIFLPIY